MARTKSKPTKQVTGLVEIKSDTGRMHKPVSQERWRNYILTPWTDPNEYPNPSARTAIQNANRAWRQTYPRNTSNSVPTLKELAMRKIPGTRRYKYKADGSYF